MTTKYNKILGTLRACKQATNNDSRRVGAKKLRPHRSKSLLLRHRHPCRNENTKIYNFLVMEKSCASAVSNGNGNHCGQFTLSAAKFVSSSHINLCYCISALRRSKNNSGNSNNNNKRDPPNKGSQKVSGFITCSNSSISLLTTRRHAKVRKICRALHRLWSGLNHPMGSLGSLGSRRCYSLVC